jgi:hypothetical protein
MIEEDIHSCGYHCQIPACIKAQRDELVDKFVKDSFSLTGALHWRKIGWNEALDEAAARINNVRGFGQATQDSFAVFIKGLKKTI